MFGSLPIKRYRFPAIISSYPSSLFALIFCISSIVLSYFSYQGIQQSQLLNEHRYQGYILATQLQQRLQQLTLMARRYAVTGEIKYLHFYNELVDNYQQNKAQPRYYYRPYWELSNPGNSISPFSAEEDKSLQKLMEMLNLTEAEAALLLQVNNSAEQLSMIELQAFSEVGSSLASAEGYQRSEERQHAISLLFSNGYLIEKTNIKSFINDFLALQAARTEQELKSAASQQSILMTATVLCFLCAIVFLLYSLRQQLKNKGMFVKALRREVSKRTLALFEKREQLKVVINEMEMTKHQLVESEKMASLGNLVSGIAHEVNTPLGISVTLGTHLQSETKQLVDKVESGQLKRSDLERYCAETIENCELLQSNLERAANLISSFKQVAVDQSCDELRTFKMSEYIDEVLLSLRPRLKKTKIKLEINAPQHEPLLTTYPGAIAQIITNLVMNSLIHAFSDGQDAGHIHFTLSIENTSMQLQFSDDGKGMNAEALAHLFEPFFTTRRGNGGSGLGMHVVYNLVVQRLTGSIRCESKVGEGTHFFISFPLEVKA